MPELQDRDKADGVAASTTPARWPAFPTRPTMHAYLRSSCITTARGAAARTVNSFVAALWQNRESRGRSMSKCNVRISRSVCSGIGVSPVGPLKTPEKHVQLGEALRTPQRINPRYCVPQRIIRSLVRLRLGNSLPKLSEERKGAKRSERSFMPNIRSFSLPFPPGPKTVHIYRPAEASAQFVPTSWAVPTTAICFS